MVKKLGRGLAVAVIVAVGVTGVGGVSDLAPMAAATTATNANHTARVTLNGRREVGSSLSAVVSGVPAGAEVQFQWFRNGQTLAGATNRGRGITARDAGAELMVRATIVQPGRQNTVLRASATVRNGTGATPNNSTASPSAAQNLIGTWIGGQRVGGWQFFADGTGIADRAGGGAFRWVPAGPGPNGTSLLEIQMAPFEPTESEPFIISYVINNQGLFTRDTSRFPGARMDTATNDRGETVSLLHQGGWDIRWIDGIANPNSQVRDDRTWRLQETFRATSITIQRVSGEDAAGPVGEFALAGGGPFDWSRGARSPFCPPASPGVNFQRSADDGQIWAMGCL